MGTTASVNLQQQAQQMQQPTPEELRKQRGHDDDEGASSQRRSGRASTRTVNAKSVRQMALMNHARHENSYISPEAFSSHTKALSVQPNPEDEFRPDFASKQKSASPSNQKAPTVSFAPVKMRLNVPDKIVEEEAPAPSLGKMGQQQSLSMFRSTFNLKLNVEDDPDWGKVDDDKDDDMNLFDKTLIEVPNEDDSPLPDKPPVVKEPKPVEKPTAKVTDMQFNDKGALFVDGMAVGIGDDGLIRPGKATENRSHRLPMRERLVMLCKLGAGASSTVYKALDLTENRLVAIKSLQVFEK